MDQQLEIKNDAFYKTEAQKFDINLKKLNQNPFTQLRWIWQLIKNAKDVPNRFGKVKIKQRLNEKQFISSHNGDAFTKEQLQNVVANYSTKQIKNASDIKTTRKYGTGLITTHIISNKIKIQSILKYEKDRQEKVNIIKREDIVKKGSENKIKQINKKSYIKIQQDQIPYYSQGENSLSQFTNKFCYAKILNLVLDRSYQNKDKQLALKIKKSQRRLQQIKLEAKNQTNSGSNLQLIQYYQFQRDLDSYDTHFRYEIQKAQKYFIIEKAVKNVKSLIPYAFLFNHNLYYYQFVDQRINNKNLSFSIKRGETTNVVQNISLFKYYFSIQFDTKKKEFINFYEGYFLEKFNQNNPIAAIPIKINNDSWQILKVDQSLPQVFIDFPLIGSAPLKWNAVINSNYFHSDEKMQYLLLKNSYLINKEHINSNKQHLLKCFQGIKDLYVFLAQKNCQKGVQNLLIFSSNNYYTIQNPQLRIITQKYIDEILDLRFLPAKRDSKMITCKLSELSFIQSKNFNLSFQQRIKFSFYLHKNFSFLYADKFLIQDSFYEDFFNKFDSLKFLSKDQYIYYENCFKDLKIIGFKAIYEKFKQKAFQILHNIYRIKDIFRIGLQMFQICLNENLQFVAFKPGMIMKKRINKLQQQLLISSGINFRQFVIHQGFIKYFQKQLKNYQEFDQAKMQGMIMKRFQKLQKFKFKIHSQKVELVFLYQFLKTFRVCPQINHNYLPQLNIFYSVEPLKFSKLFKNQEILSDRFLKVLSSIFARSLQRYLCPQIEKKSLQNHLDVESLSKQQFVFKKNFYLDYLKVLQSSNPHQKQKARQDNVNFKISRRLRGGVQPPNQNDLQIYDILRKQNDQPLSSILVHNQVSKQVLKTFPQVTYKQLYQHVQKNYEQINDKDKQKVLSYAQSIRRKIKFSQSSVPNQTDSQKYGAWKDFIQNRHVKMLEIRKSHPSFEKQYVKDFLFEIFKDPQKLQMEAENYFKRNKPAVSTPSKTTQNQNNNLLTKKIKID